MAGKRLSARGRNDSGIAVRVRLLGGFSVSVGARSVEGGEWRRKAGSLVKILSLSRGHRMHREGMSNLLWPGLDAERANNNLHRTLHFARRSLAPASITLRDGMLSLCPDGDFETDIEAFEEAAAVARRSRRPSAYRAAIELYSGELLPEDRFEEWAEEKRNELRALLVALLVELAASHEERGEYSPGAEVLRRALVEEPANEEAHAALMRLLSLRGDSAGAALHYERLDRALARKFGMKPGPAVRRLYEDIRAGRPVETRRTSIPNGSPPGNLPVPLTSFVGREREMVEMRRTLAMARLLTLTGAGGCGKTRLAAEVGRDFAGVYEDGVWLVELAALMPGPDSAPKAAASALGVGERAGLSLTDTLAEYLRKKSLLLILDNCEHVVDDAAKLSDALLRTCENLRILATSREPLGVPGEVVWAVNPLSLPGDGEGVATSEAVRLFVERARSRLPGFELTGSNADAVVRVCEKLDGIPLAIELATARMGSLAVEKVAERLEGSLGLLAGGPRTVAPRHRTMRATVEWSHDLLDEPERMLFRRLSVFAGGFSLEAAEAVCSGEGVERGEILDILSRLVEKSLAAAEGGMRYRMLEPIREYARERLEDVGEDGEAPRRHAMWHIELAKKVEPWPRGGRREAWLDLLEEEYGNLGAALEWTLEAREFDLALWFGAALGEFWYFGGRLGEARRWLEAALAGDGEASAARSKILARTAWISWEQGDYEASKSLSEKSLELSKKLGDEPGISTALTTLGWANLLETNLDEASKLADEAAGISRSLEDPGGVARALLITGLAAVARKDHRKAVEVHEESIALAREANDDVAATVSLVMGTLAHLGRGDEKRARAVCEEGLAHPPRPEVMNVRAFQISSAAALAASMGSHVRSARLWGAAEAIRETIGAILSPVERHVYGPYIEAAREKLAPPEWGKAWAEGNEMDAEEAIEYALAEEERPRPLSIAPESTLTRREKEISALVAGGFTNRSIAEELSISRRTVDTHVGKILKKLGLHSRKQIPARATKQSRHTTG